VRVAVATSSAVPEDLRPDAPLIAALTRRGATVALVPWDDPVVDWDGFDLVVVRSTWDYAPRRDAFLAWTDARAARLQNSADLIRWNSDKRYLADLATAGVTVVPTTYVAPGEPLPSLAGEVVVKPTVSIGAIDTGRFGPVTHDEAARLAARIHARGGSVMLQPYVPTVDTAGETAVVCIDGRPSHGLHKRAVLRPDEVAPIRDDAIGAAEAMYDPDLVTGTDLTPAETSFAAQVVEAVTERFGVPLYARVDMVTGDDGRPVLMELEAVEPHLYLDVAPAAADRLARAIVARIEDGAGPGGRPHAPTRDDG
jgi:glutathione synthase/RimK-type ligase-like ATP-grasp enzyme